PRLAHALLVARELGIRRRAFERERGENGLCSEHSALQRRMRTLDLRGVQEPGVAADEHAARKRQSRQRLKAAFVYGPRAVRNPLAAGEELAHARVLLPALKL